MISLYRFLWSRLGLSEQNAGLAALLIHMLCWFLAGGIIGWSVSIVILQQEWQFLAVTVGSFTAVVFGYGGGMLRLLRWEDQD